MVSLDDRASRRVLRDYAFHIVGGGGFHGLAAPITQDAKLAAFELAGTLGSGKVAGRPNGESPNSLMVFELRVCFADDFLSVRAVGKSENRMNAFSPILSHADDCRFADAMHLIKDALDILGEDVQAVGGDDHLLLTAANREAAGFVYRAYISCVEPAILECLCRLGIGIQIAGSDIVATNKNFAIIGDLDLDPSDGLARQCLSVYGTDDSR